MAVIIGRAVGNILYSLKTQVNFGFYALFSKRTLWMQKNIGTRHRICRDKPNPDLCFVLALNLLLFVSAGPKSIRTARVHQMHRDYWISIDTYLGSQWAIRKSKYSLVTNISVSSRISCTLGGGSAIASDTAPNSGGAHFRLCENVYCGLSLQTNSTTWE